MSEDLIRYDILAQEALRGVVKKVLTEVSRTGLPGEHHFYITFQTQAPGVRLSPRLLERYPEDMTIVLQHQFWDMTANEQAIEIGLSFDGIPEKLYIPYTAIITFIDPSVHFSLQFEVEGDDDLTDFEEFEGDEEEQGVTEATVLTVMNPRGGDTPEEADRETETKAATDDASSSDSDPAQAGQDSKDESGAEVVSLDAFRKK